MNDQELSEIKAEFLLVHKEIGELRTMLSAKADVARLEALEARVNSLERALSQAK